MVRAALSRFKARVISFFDDPHSSAPLGIFRLTIASFLLLQAIIWYPDWLAFLGPEGWLQWEISHALTEEWTPHIERVYRLLSPLGLSAEQFVMLFFWCYVIAGMGLLVGWHTRVWAVIAWFLHYILMGTLRTFTYGVDIFLHIALFYMMFMPVAKAYSLDVWQGRASPLPTWGVTLSLRVLQIHLCFVYLSAGFEKAMSPDWWDGNVIWRSLVQPDFRQFDFTWLAHYPWMAAALSWSTIIIETGYCLAMWIPRVRAFWLAGVVSLHLGIGLFLGLWFFGLIMILLSVSAFGYDAWQDVRDRGRSALVQLTRRLRRRWRIRQLVSDLDSQRRDEIATVFEVIRYVTEGRRPSFEFNRGAAEALVTMGAVEALPKLRKLLKKSPHGYTYIDFYYDSTHGGPEESADYQWPEVVRHTIEALEKIERGYSRQKNGDQQ